MNRLREPNEKVIHVFFRAIQLKWFSSIEPRYGEDGRDYFMFDRLEIDPESYSWRAPGNPEFLLIGYRVSHDAKSDEWHGDKIEVPSNSAILTRIFEYEIVYSNNILDKLSHEKVKVMLKEGKRYGH